MCSSILRLALLLAPACGDSGRADGETTGAEGPGTASPSGAPTEDGPPPPPPTDICERFLACVDATRPDRSLEIDARYGPGGTCWKRDPAELGECSEACDAGLESYHRSFPRVAACMLCTSDDQCDSLAGEFCFAGGCELTCDDPPFCP